MDICREKYSAAAVNSLLALGMKALEASLRLPTAVYSTSTLCPVVANPKHLSLWKVNTTNISENRMVKLSPGNVG